MFKKFSVFYLVSEILALVSFLIFINEMFRSFPAFLHEPPLVYIVAAFHFLFILFYLLTLTYMTYVYPISCLFIIFRNIRNGDSWYMILIYFIISIVISFIFTWLVYIKGFVLCV